MSPECLSAPLRCEPPVVWSQLGRRRESDEVPKEGEGVIAGLSSHFEMSDGVLSDAENPIDFHFVVLGVLGHSEFTEVGVEACGATSVRRQELLVSGGMTFWRGPKSVNQNSRRNLSHGRSEVSSVGPLEGPNRASGEGPEQA